MSLSKNTAMTLASAVVQIGVTLVTLPIFISVIGLERYGAAVLIWLVIDYLAILNLGLDRAAINMISRFAADAMRASRLFWTALSICCVTGGIGAVLVYQYFGLAMGTALSIDATLVDEIHYGFIALAALLFQNVLSSIASASLQAQERFLEVNVAQVAMSVAFQVAPVVAAAVISPTLETIVVTGCIARSLQGFLYFAFCWRKRARPQITPLSKADAMLLMRYGAWASLTGVISPVIFNLDRLVLGRLLGSAAVSLYTVPYNLVMKAQLIPGSLSTALFPRLSQASDLDERRTLAGNALLTMAAVLALGLIIGSFFFQPFLSLWIHSLASRDAIAVGQILIAGVWFNGLAIVPYIWLQATGKPDVVAKIHAAELVPFALALWLLVDRFGVAGAAMAWTLRVLADALLLFWLAGMAGELRKLAWPTAFIFVATGLNAYLANRFQAAGLCGAVLFTAQLVWAWRMLPRAQRDRVLARLASTTGTWRRVFRSS